MAYLFVVLLLLLSGTLVGLPLLPAICELRQKQDAEPLKVIQQHAGDIRYFASSFATLIKELEPLVNRSRTSGDVCRGVLPDGSQYIIMRTVDELPRMQKQNDLFLCPNVIAFSNDVTCPGQIKFAKELYVHGQFRGGDCNQYRAVLGMSGIRLGKRSSVLRWAHAAFELVADEECQLYGRVSAAGYLTISQGCRFFRLNAPRINIGQGSGNNPANRVPREPGVSVPLRRVLHHGDVIIEAGEVVYGSIVARGKLHLRSGAKVVGSIKSNKDLVIENEAVVEGGVICSERMIVGSRCTLLGPIIAERSMVLYHGTVCGDLQKPTTVSSPEIQVQEGVVIFGTLWARQSGSVWGRA